MHPSSLMPTAAASRALGVANMQSLVRVGLGVCLLTAASHVTLPFLHTPVPFTLQPQAVLLLAATVGAFEALGAVAAWLWLGALGAPVFASELPGSWALLGPTGGYLGSYLPVAYVVGRWGRGYGLRAAGVWLAGAGLTLAMGALWLSQTLGGQTAWALGVVPFAAADLYKASATFLVRRALHTVWPRRH